MQRRILDALAVLLGSFLAGAAGAAPEGWPAPEVAPQWTRILPGTIDYSLDARTGAGALVGADDRLVALAPDGTVRWIASRCPGCGSSHWTHAILTDDGGAWALESAQESGTQRLVRLDAEGRLERSVPLEVALHPLHERHPLFGDSDHAIVLDGIGHAVRWQRVDLASGQVEARTIVLSEGSFFRLADARPLPDGGVSVAFGSSCGDIPVCPPPPLAYSIARLDSEGALLWHVAGGGAAALDSQGGAHIIATGLDDSKYLRRVTPAGEVRPGILLQGLEYADRWPRVFVHGPHAGILALRVTSQPHVTTFWSIDLAGHVLATRRFDEDAYVLDDSPLGLVVRAFDTGPAVAQWLDPASLETRAYFHVLHEEAEGPAGFGAARLLRDGTLYGAIAVPGTGEVPDTVLARFIAPGFTAPERRHRAQTGRALLRHQADPGTPRLH